MKQLCQAGCILGMRVPILALWAASACAEIPRPDDAPKPLPPAESAAKFQVPAGHRIRLLASEPLITEPSGICWDEKGRCFVCELHGYNLEGQYDIDELNKTGQLDLEVRRIQAGEEAKKKAEAQTYGTVKLLRDTDGDGVMDKAVVWADRLPPCHGIAAGNGGVIIACSPHIVFLKDSDGDDRPDIQDWSGASMRRNGAVTAGSTSAGAGAADGSRGITWRSPCICRAAIFVFVPTARPSSRSRAARTRSALP